MIINIKTEKINIKTEKINIFFTKEQINKIYELYTENMPNFTPVSGVECYFKNANPDKIIFKGHDLGSFKIDGDIPKEGYEEYNISSPEKLFALKGDFKLIFDCLDDGASWHTKYTVYDSSGKEIYNS